MLLDGSTKPYLNRTLQENSCMHIKTKKNKKYYFITFLINNKI